MSLLLASNTCNVFKLLCVKLFKKKKLDDKPDISVAVDLTVQTVNTGIISGMMLCSLQNKRKIFAYLANRGENEASQREAREN